MAKLSYSTQIFTRAELETFAAQWPCFGLPDNVQSIWFQFQDSNGDLVDMGASNGLTDLPSGWDEAMDGSGLVALSHDASDKLYPKDS